MKVELNAQEVELLKGLLTMVDPSDSTLAVYNKLTPKPKVKKEVPIKRYSYSFIGGGWNTSWGKTKRGAIKAAKAQYKGTSTLVVDETTFQLCGTDSYNNLLNMSL